MTADNVHWVRAPGGRSGGRSGPSAVTATLDAIRADPELAPATRRFGDKLVRSLWLRRGAPARARLSVPVIAYRLDVCERTVRAHLSALIAAGYLTAEGRQGGRKGRKGRGIVPVWSLSTRQKIGDVPGETCRVEKPEKIAAYSQVRADSVRVSTRQNLPTSSRESLTALSLDSKNAFGGDDWTAPADVPARVAELRAALTRKSA